MTILLLLLAVVCLACRTNYVPKTSANSGQPGLSYMPQATALKLNRGRNPCGVRQCATCAGGLSFDVMTRRYGPIALTAHKSTCSVHLALILFPSRLAHFTRSLSRRRQGFISVLDKVFGDLGKDKPAVLARIGTAGAICCRLIKLARGGCSTSWSNHGTKKHRPQNARIDAGLFLCVSVWFCCRHENGRYSGCARGQLHPQTATRNRSVLLQVQIVLGRRIQLRRRDAL